MPDRAESTTWGQKARYGEFEIVGARDAKPRILGEGSFGKTFEGVRTDTVAGGVIEEHVAVKVLNPTLLISESRRLQVVQELVALTKFKHSNLIHYIRCGEDEGEVYYAMELCRGGDLARLVRRYRVLPEKIAALIGLQVATGLREVHQRHRLVHRDIKPSNIMLVDELESGLGVTQLAERLEEQEGLCRIVDFGLVSFALNMKEAHERFVGSPMYASPEQINEQPLDGRSDIYSLGMTLWYLVQGKGPLLDANGNDLKGVREAMRRHALPEEHRAHLPPHLSEEFRNILA
jgi:serine/threonine protein kinase